MRILEKIRKLPLKWRKIIFVIIFLILAFFIAFLWTNRVLKRSFFEIKRGQKEIKEIKGPSLREKLEKEIRHFQLLLPRFPKPKQ